MSPVTESRSGPFFMAHASDPGAVRNENEDACLARGGEGFWLVADGMGGLDDGQWASRTLAVELAEAPFSGDLERDAATVAEVIRHGNYVIFKESTARQNHMGSTALALLIRGDRFAVVWAGDSRLYLLRDGVLSQVSVDHTQVQQLVTAGYLTRKEAADHPMSHVLSRAVGTQPDVETEMLVGEARAGDLFLLCSDGLPRVMADEEIAREMQGGNPVAMVERMLAIALERGSPDNVTVMVVGCGDPAGAAMAPTPPVFGGAASDAAASPAPTATAAAPPPPLPPAATGPGGMRVLVGAIVGILIIAALGVGGWLLLPRLRPPTATAHQVATAPAVPDTGLRQFESALGGVSCSWLQITKMDPGPTGVDIGVSGVAASPAAVQGALTAAAASAKVQVADIDLSAIAASPPGLCSTLDALRPYRAATSQTGQNLSAAQDSFAVMKQADGKQAGRAIVTATPPPQGDFAVLELGADDSLSVVAGDRRTFLDLAKAATAVTKVPDAGGYRLQADYAKPGWSSLILLTGQGPFPHALLTQPGGPRSAAWASQFAAAARAGGWRAEMAWYDITTGGGLSVIPQTPGAGNSLSAANALAAARLLQQQIRKPPATNAGAAAPTNAATPAATNASAAKAEPPL